MPAWRGRYYALAVSAAFVPGTWAETPGTQDGNKQGRNENPAPSVHRHGGPLQHGAVAQPQRPRLIATFPSEDGSIGPMQFSPNGRSLAFTVGDNLILWEVATRQVRATFRDRFVAKIAFTSDSKCLATVGQRGVDGKLLDLATGRVRAEYRRHTTGPVSEKQGDSSEKERAELNRTVIRLAVAPDGKMLACGSSGGGVSLYELDTGKELATLPPGKKDFSVKDLAFSPDGRTLAVAGGRAWRPAYGEVRLWDVAARRLRATLRDDDLHVNQVAFSPDGKTLATGATVWNLEGGDALQSFVKLWNPATGELRTKWKMPLVGMSSVAFSPDSRVLAVGGYQPDPPLFFDSQGETRFFEVATGKEVASIQAQAQRKGLNRVAFSPDGKLLAVTGVTIKGPTRDTYLVELWDVSLFCAEGPARWGFPAQVRKDTGPVGRKPEPSGGLTREELKARWSDLAGDDAPRAYGAIWSLVRAPHQAAVFLERHLRPVPPIDPKRFARLIMDLESEQFAVRQRAALELERAEEQAEPALRKTLQGKPSPETRERVEQLLAKLDGPVTSPEKLQALRALEVLEHIGSAEARRILETLAKGALRARVTQEAILTLDRLSRRASAP